MKALLLGYGMQGKGALYDMIKFGDFSEIYVFDNKPDLAKELDIVECDNVHLFQVEANVTDGDMDKLVAEVDIVVCMLPSGMVLEYALRTVKAGTNFACSSYLKSFSTDENEKARVDRVVKEINETALKNDVTVLAEFGLDPGLDLLLANKAVNEFDTVSDFISYGAGFPEYSAADNSIKYKFTWNIEGVMKSYYRPAKIIRDSKPIYVSPGKLFAEEFTHQLELEELGGVLDCFPNGDSEYYAKKFGIDKTVVNMGRYVCRWKGHCDYWRVMAESGFMKDENLTVDGVEINKIKYLSTMFKNDSIYFYKDNERDVTLTRIDVKGSKNGEAGRVIYQIIDKRDLETGFTSMTRTVGFVLSLGVQMILNGRIRKKGIVQPFDLDFKTTADELAKRNIIINRIDCKV